MEVYVPKELSLKLLKLSNDYSKYSGEFAKLIKIQADYFNAHREEYKSDNATQKAFDSTNEGVTIVVVKLKLKALEKEMSAIKHHLRLLENEAKNIY